MMWLAALAVTGLQRVNEAPGTIVVPGASFIRPRGYDSMGTPRTRSAATAASTALRLPRARAMCA
jgi:hypothetical protein